MATTTQIPWITGVSASSIRSRVQDALEAVRITVKIQDIRDAADALENERSRFVAAVLAKYAHIDLLGNSWADESNTISTNLVREFVQDFVDMDRFLREQIEFLRASADKYEATLNRVNISAEQQIVRPRRR